MISHFIVYGEMRQVPDLTLHDVQFQQGGDFEEVVYHIVGSFRSQKFEVIYNESESMVLIVLDEQQRAILSLINTNPESMSSGGVRLSKNKKAMLGAGGVINTPEVSIESSEWYPLYVVAGVDDPEATEMGLMFLLLFFSVAQTGG